MSKEINTGKLTIQDVFSKWYRIPSYQRPYVWGKDQIIELLDDISYAFEKDESGQYFLGSLVLQENKEQEYTEYDVLDGQQRLTTLFLIMAVIRDLTKNKDLKEACGDIIFQKGNKFKQIPERIRILFDTRNDVKEFADTYIKIENGTQDVSIKKILDSKDISKSTVNMVNAVGFIKEYFKENENLNKNFEIDTLAYFLINNVILIYVSTENLDDAFKLFTVLNNRGIKLRSADILKADNLSFIENPKDADNYAQEWEKIENYFGEDFDKFLSHLQSILTKEKARSNLLDEFEKNIFKSKKYESNDCKKPILNKGKDFFNFIKKYKEHHEYLFDNNQNLELKNLIKLMQVGFVGDLWIAPLLRYYDKFGKENLVDFVKKLNNKFASDWIANLTPTARIYNMNEIITQIENVEYANELLSHDCLKIDEKSILRFIQGSIYGKRPARYILLLVNYLYHSQETEFVIPNTISVEHILPKNPKDNSQWKKDFNDESRMEWTDKIGNLIIISRRKNSSQSNKDFSEKKAKYFKGNVELGRSAFIMSKNAWKLDDLKNNHQDALNKLKENYGISIDTKSR